MAVLGDDKGNILARKMGKSLDFQHLGTARARQNLSRLVHSLPSWKTEGRLHAVAIAMQSQFLYEPDHFKDMVQTVVGAEDIKLRLHCFQEAAMQCVPGRKPDVVVLTDTVGAVLGRDKTGAISKLVTGGGALSIVNAAVQRVKEKPADPAARKVQKCLNHWWSTPCRSRAPHVARCIIRLAEEGDLLALELLNSGANAIVKGMAAVLKQLGTSTALIGLSGCTALDSHIVNDRIRRAIGGLFPQCEIVEAAHAPAKGAYLWSLAASAKAKSET